MDENVKLPYTTDAPIVIGLTIITLISWAVGAAMF